MITTLQGNLLKDNAEALVNTVNCVGVLGKGVALQFKKAFPQLEKPYQEACKSGDLAIGKVQVVMTGLFMPRYVINFPTKGHWKANSRLGDIEAGLASLVEEVRKLGIRSIALPPLGCGNGGLRWGEVEPLIRKAFAALPDVEVRVYPPQSDLEASLDVINTKKQSMTPGRAMLVTLIGRYMPIIGQALGMLEVQKLAYFLQAAGQPMRLEYTAYKYGPYADNLNHTLERIDGHLVKGVGDRSSIKARIELLPGVLEEAEAYLANDSVIQNRLRRVEELIEGFEDEFGMELLATVHWVAQRTPGAREDVALTIEAVRRWSERKKDLFKPEYIQKAWTRLEQKGWLGEADRLAL